MKDQMKTVKGGDGPLENQFCLSCFCPEDPDEYRLYLDTNWVALQYVPGPETD